MKLVLTETLVGSGRRLLDHPSEAVGLRLVEQEVTPSGLVVLEYEPVGAARVAEYEGVTAFV